MEFPMYFSLVPTPGYNISYLETCGIDGEWDLFTGDWNDSAWAWGGNCSLDIVTEAKLDVLEVLGWVSLQVKNVWDEIEIEVEDMSDRKMLIDTRPRYPSDKITFTIADLTKNRAIHYFNIGLNLNGQFDVDVVLEDSQRDFLSSFI